MKLSHCVFIDQPPSSTGVVLLTHAHSDSYGALRSQTVWCSAETAWLMAPKGTSAPRTHSLFLEPHVTYSVVTAPGGFTVRRYNRGSRVETVFTPFATEHCAGSLGFWFPREGLLYVGDSRCSKDLLQGLRSLVQPLPVRHVVGDFLWADYKFPALATSIQQLQNLLTHLLKTFTRVKVLCPHSGTLWAMALLPSVCWSVGVKTAWSKVDVLQLARYLAPKHCSRKSRSRIVVGSVEQCKTCPPCSNNPAEYTKYDLDTASNGQEATVLLSAAWFLVHGLEPESVYYNAASQTFRTFVAFHADQGETYALQKQFPKATFSAAATRPFRAAPPGTS